MWRLLTFWSEPDYWFYSWAWSDVSALRNWIVVACYRLRFYYWSFSYSRRWLEFLAYVYSEQIDRELKQSFKQTLTTKYSIDRSITEAADLLHQNHGCCGADSFLDWRNSTWLKNTNTEEKIIQRQNESNSKYGIMKAPDICCRTVAPYCGYRDHPSMIYYDGCIGALKQDIQEHEIIIGAIGLGISTVQIFGMVISCCLYIKLKDYEYVKEGKKRPTNNYYWFHFCNWHSRTFYSFCKVLLYRLLCVDLFCTAFFKSNYIFFAHGFIIGQYKHLIFLVE